MLYEARRTLVLRTREVRLASPNSAVRHGLRGRGFHEEEKRAFHQGPKALRGLQTEVGYMTASILLRASVLLSLDRIGFSFFQSQKSPCLRDERGR